MSLLQNYIAINIIKEQNNHKKKTKTNTGALWFKQTPRHDFDKIH